MNRKDESCRDRHGDSRGGATIGTGGRPFIEIDPRAQSYEELCHGFRWRVPARFNIASEVCGRWAVDRGRFALYYEDRHGFTSAHSFWDIQQDANRLANVLAALGTVRGDRVAVFLPQRPEAAIAHVAIAQMAAIAVPLSPSLAPEMLERSLGDSAAYIAIVDETTMAALLALRDRLPRLRHVLGAGAARGHGIREWTEVLEHASPRYAVADTAAADPAMILYPGGSAGWLVAHRTLPGTLSGYLCAHDFGPHPGDLFWSPADWGSADGLWNGLLPSWHFGVPLLAYNGPLDPAKALALMQRYAVRNCLIGPSSLRMIRKSFPEPKARFDVELRTLVCTGEPVDEAMQDWAGERLGVTITEIWGLAEVAAVAGSCAGRWSAGRGSLGRAYPGHRLAVVDGAGRVLPAGQTGQLAVNRQCNGEDDPLLGRGYWNRALRPEQRLVGDGWLLTGSLARMNEQGDLLAPGPEGVRRESDARALLHGEIEDRLRVQPATAACAVADVDEAATGGALKAVVVPQPGSLQSLELCGELLDELVGNPGSAGLPNEVEWAGELPDTPDGRTCRHQSEASGQAGEQRSGTMSKAPGRPAGAPSLERRNSGNLRAVFEDAFALLEPFLDPDQGWAGHSLAYLAHRLVAQNFPHLDPEEVHALVVEVLRTYIERHPEGSGHLPRPEELHLVKL